MFAHQKPAVVVKQLVLVAAAATAVALINSPASSSSQLANGQASNSADWTSSEDSWNYWWSYSGISGPAYWGLLNLDWHMCDKGKRQSPINIETNRLVYDPHLSPLQLDTNLISGILHNDGHAIVLNVSAKRPKQQNINNNIRQQQPTEVLIGSGEATTKLTTNRSRRNMQDALGNSLIRIAPIVGSVEDSSASHLNTRDLSQKVDLSISQSEALDSSELSSNLNEEQVGFSSAAAASDDGSAAAYDDNGSNDEDDDGSTNKRQVQISGAGLSYGYRFEAIYFRFGLDNKQAGSEHLINSKWHSGELQILAYNSVLYKSFYEASSKPHGLLAISILVDVFDRPANSKINSQLEKLLLPLNEIKYRNQMVEVKEFNLSALLPDKSQFVTYEGSLNVPGCHESVDWLVLNRPLYIMQSSLDLLRSISADEPKSDTASATLIGGNLRPVQAANNRPIRTNIKPPSKVNSQLHAKGSGLGTITDWLESTELEAIPRHVSGGGGGGSSSYSLGVDTKAKKLSHVIHKIQSAKLL